MFVLTFFICLFAFAYIMYKVRAVRTKRPIEKDVLDSKSSMSLGLFIAAYGLNQLLLNRSAWSTVIGIIFILVGAASCWAGYKAYRHYNPIFEKEMQRKENHHA
jgi:4-amino-4-deoxy-L-arabinose transferase-like glycosyltransferase